MYLLNFGVLCCFVTCALSILQYVTKLLKVCEFILMNRKKNSFANSLITLNDLKGKRIIHMTVGSTFPATVGFQDSDFFEKAKKKKKEKRKEKERNMC